MYALTSSGLQASSVAIVAGPAVFYGITLLQASAACTAILYDNATTNTGTEIEQINNTVNSSTVTVKLSEPVVCNKGIYLALTGTGAKAIVHYGRIG